jgi:hypothetical protein
MLPIQRIELSFPYRPTWMLVASVVTLACLYKVDVIASLLRNMTRFNLFDNYVGD